MNTADSARVLGVEQATINQLVRRGKLEADRIGTALDVKAKSVWTYRERRISDLLDQVEAMQANVGIVLDAMREEQA